MEFKRAIPYSISIRPSDNAGFAVKIGCGRLVFASSTALIAFLSEYFADPEGTEKKYNESRGNLASVGDRAATETAAPPVERPDESWDV